MHNLQHIKKQNVVVAAEDDPTEKEEKLSGRLSGGGTAPDREGMPPIHIAAAAAFQLGNE